MGVTAGLAGGAAEGLALGAAAGLAGGAAEGLAFGTGSPVAGGAFGGGGMVGGLHCGTPAAGLAEVLAGVELRRR